MVQQDNKPNNHMTVDGKSLVNSYKKKPAPTETREYIEDFQRDDDPLLSDNERTDTRNDDLIHREAVQLDLGGSHPV